MIIKINQLKRKAQASVEYFLLFMLIAGLTALSVSSFWPRVYDYVRLLFWRSCITIGMPGNVDILGLFN